MKIGFYNDHNHPMLCYWNVTTVIDAINASGRAKAWNINRKDPNSYKDCDVIVFYRTSGYSIDFMKELKRQGKVVCYSIDDYLWCDAFKGTGFYHPVSPFIPHCDLFYVPSDKLAEKVPKGTETFYSEPCLTDEVFSILSSEERKPTSLFSVLITKGHITPPFIKYVKDIVVELRDKKIEKSIAFHYFGNFNELSNLSSGNIYFVKHNFVGGNPLNFYHYLKKINVDIFLNPLEETEFNDCKCPLKYFESGAMRSALITSRTHPFSSRYTEGEDVMFASSPKEFADKIEMLMNDRDLLAKISSNAFEKTKKENVLSVTINDYINKMEQGLDKLKKNPDLIKRWKYEPSSEMKKSISEFINVDTNTKNPDKGKPEGKPNSNDLSLDVVCHPIPFGKWIELNIETARKTLKGFWVKGATYGFKLDVPPRVELFSGHKLIFSGLFDVATLVDNSWWPMFFTEQRLPSRFLKIRIHNNDKRPISFYLSREKAGLAARIGETASEPIAVNLV